MPTALLYALVIVYVIITIVCIMIMFGAMSIAGGSPLYLLLAPAWPVLIPYFYYQKWRNQVEVDAHMAKIKLEMDARDREHAANVKLAEAKAAAARETQVAQVTEAKTAATTVSAAAPATEPAK